MVHISTFYKGTVPVAALYLYCDGYHTSNVQTLRNSYAGERFNFSHAESESKKKFSKAALKAHILSETTRDESTSTC